MILVTGGTGLNTFIVVFDRVRKSQVEKIRAIYRNSSTIEKQSPYLSFMTNYPCLTL
jgi:hypothetical protein